MNIKKKKNEIEKIINNKINIYNQLEHQKQILKEEILKLQGKLELLIEMEKKDSKNE